MPINPIVLQRRHAELGRIRLGDKGAKGQPQKLTQFRFTSPHQRHIADLAQLYGGTAQPWRNGTRDEWEVYSEATTIPVIVVRGGVSHWLETWSGGGCQRRCDGEREMITDQPCLCDNEPGDRTCKPTTRLSVMLRDLHAIGVWRLESHGWNAAAELPGLVELAQHVADLVPARLILSERISIKDGRTSRFVVPGLDLEVAPARLAQIVSGIASTGVQDAVPAPLDTQAIASAPVPDYAGALAAAATIEDCQAIWHLAGSNGHLTDALKAAIKARGNEITAQTTSPAQDEDTLWAAIVAKAGELGMTDRDLRSQFQALIGSTVELSDAGQLEFFLTALRTGDVSTSGAA